MYINVGMIYVVYWAIDYLILHDKNNWDAFIYDMEQAFIAKLVLFKWCCKGARQSGYMIPNKILLL